VDGDANSIDVTIESNKLGITSVVVTDDGEGMPFSEVSTLFTNLGGSWKRLSGHTKTKHRMLHGEEGKGRFRALALGRVVDWIVTVKGTDSRLDRYKITIERDSPRRVTISELKKARKGSRAGVDARSGSCGSNSCQAAAIPVKLWCA
jgi:Histidine kinase-, DNA gyrase B-, and HSP90-like ATPase